MFCNEGDETVNAHPVMNTMYGMVGTLPIMTDLLLGCRPYACLEHNNVFFHACGTMRMEQLCCSSNLNALHWQTELLRAARVMSNNNTIQWYSVHHIPYMVYGVFHRYTPLECTAYKRNGCESSHR